MFKIPQLPARIWDQHLHQVPPSRSLNQTDRSSGRKPRNARLLPATCHPNSDPDRSRKPCAFRLHPRDQIPPTYLSLHWELDRWQSKLAIRQLSKLKAYTSNKLIQWAAAARLHSLKFQFYLESGSFASPPLQNVVSAPLKCGDVTFHCGSSLAALCNAAYDGISNRIGGKHLASTRPRELRGDFV